MIFKSKYNPNEFVYFWNEKKKRICKGNIYNISLFFSSTINSVSWSYWVKEVNNDNSLITIQVDESLIFKSKDEVLDFACEITKIFDE